MRSAELANIAGVSVRTLRHYHSLGLLAEPSRRENGYRDYSAFDLAEVLRIKRLASLGFSLAEIGAMRKSEEEDAGRNGERRARSPKDALALTEDAALAALDVELALRIEQLQQQRRTIAQLRAESLDPSLPVRFGRVANRLFGRPIEEIWAEDDNEQDRAALIITSHICSEADIAELERFTDRLEELNLLEPMRALQERIDQLAANASEEERASLVSETMDLLEPALECLDPANWQEGDKDDLWRMIESLLDVGQNAAQQDVHARIDAAIEKAARNNSSV